MKLNSNTSILEAADLVINNLQQDPENQKKLAAVGFTQKRIQDGIALRQNAFSAIQVQDALYNEQWMISQQLNQDADAAILQFKAHAKVARIAFRNHPALLHSLKIDRFANTRWPLIRQARHFYTQLTAQAANMDAYEITQPMLEQAQASIEAVLSTKHERTRKKGVIEDSTQEKRKALATLRAWLADFRKTARFAFRDNPQMLESFGIVVSSAVK